MLFDQIEKNLWKGKLTNVLIQFCFLRLSRYFCALELPSFRCSETGISRASHPYHLTSAAVKNFPYFIFNLKFQILINFLWQMLDFCLGCSNKKCWVWFLALIFLLLTFLFFWGNPYQAIQPVKTSILDSRKIVFDAESGFLLACFSPLELDFWLWYTNTNCFSWYFKLKTWCLMLFHNIRPFSGWFTGPRMQ